jgi:hypothetical protein
VHAVHLPPRHFWRVALLATLLAFLLALASTDLGTLEFSFSGGSDSVPAASPAEPAATTTTTAPERPMWLTDPLSPPLIGTTR